MKKIILFGYFIFIASKIFAIDVTCNPIIETVNDTNEFRFFVKVKPIINNDTGKDIKSVNIVFKEGNKIISAVETGRPWDEPISKGMIIETRSIDLERVELEKMISDAEMIKSTYKDLKNKYSKVTCEIVTYKEYVVTQK